MRNNSYLIILIISLHFIQTPGLYRWPAMGIHGDKSQQERDWVLNGELYFRIQRKVI